MELSVDNFKFLMRSWPTGVAVISTIDQDGRKYGFTANTFTSVSLDPLLVSFCLRNDSSIMNIFKKHRKFAVSILSQDQAEVASHFAKYFPDKFQDFPHDFGNKTSCPLIKNSVGSLEAITKFEYSGGDHTIFIGEVVSISVDTTKSPLLYYAQAYHSVN